MREHRQHIERTAGVVLAFAALGLGTAACKNDFLSQPSDVVAAHPCDTPLASPDLIQWPDIRDTGRIDVNIVNGPAASFTTPDACVPLGVVADGAHVVVTCHEMGSIVKLKEATIINNFWDLVVTDSDGHTPAQPEWVNEAYINASLPIADCLE
jgi:hypothetical protein